MDNVGAIIVLVLYFLPMIIAIRRDHHQEVAISALNILLGWTLLGWIIAFIWALTAVRRDLRDDNQGVSKDEYREIKKQHLMPWKEARRRANARIESNLR